MTTWLVSRHQGAVEWASRQGIRIDRLVAQLDPEEVGPGDVILGNLPLHLAARVGERGARLWALTLEVPPEWRGRELTAADMDRCGARLEEFRVERRPGTCPAAGDPGPT